MPMPVDVALDALRAVGEETRLRIVLLLQHGELTVSDLTELLGQSQPRTSRHLKLLLEAGVVDRHREGTRVYFGLTRSGPIRTLVDAVIAETDQRDPVAAGDLDRLEVVHQRRATAAQQYFSEIARRWDEVRSLHAPDDDVEAAVVAIAAERPYRTLLDLGTGTGRMLQVLASADLDRAVGLDSSHSMLSVARANLERAEIRNVDLRQGDVYSPTLDPDSFDLIVIHQVLHFLDEPQRAIREAARLLSPAGRLLIVDFAPHALEFLRSDHAHRRLGLRHDSVESWLEEAGLDMTAARTLEPPSDDDAGERLTVSIWTGTDRRNSRSTDTPSPYADATRTTEQHP